MLKNIKRRIMDFFGSLFTVKVLDKIERYLAYAGIYEEPKEWIATHILLVIEWAMLGFVLFHFYGFFAVSRHSFATYANTVLLGILGGIIFGFLSLGIMLFNLYHKMSDRTDRVDNSLPDFLMVLSANIKAGMTPFEALKNSSLKEFGPLKEDVDYIITRSMGTISLSESLEMLTRRTMSDNVKNFVNFFNHAIRSGGRIANTLEVAADEMRETKDLRMKLWTALRAHVIFLVFVVIFALPFLLSISSQYILIFESIRGSVDSNDSNTLLINPQINVSIEFINFLSTITIIGTCFLASITIGILKDGKLLQGLKFAPILAIISYGLFVLFINVWEVFFGGIM
ncbi:type II secretion system F family protein [Candidatus Micrarchaeota archaeon]|nr:type II secretion system F family protein [Candidatus Micrarchaeota archaeon]